MKQSIHPVPSGYGGEFWAVSQAAAYLTNQACTLSARHIEDGTLRLEFNREVSYYANAIVNDVSHARKSAERGLRELKDEQDSLVNQSWEVTQKGVGVIAGALQFAAGAGICYGSAGLLCLFAGAPLMAHGANNVFENGHDLWNGRSDTEGPVRTAYQHAAEMIGMQASTGNVAYGAVDLGTSIYGISRMVLKPDAWRLFRYVRTDYVRAYQKASIGTQVIERGADVNTVIGIFKERNQGK